MSWCQLIVITWFQCLKKLLWVPIRYGRPDPISSLGRLTLEPDVRLRCLKKGKSSKFDGQNDSQVDSGPVDRSDSIDTRGLYSDIKNSRVGPNQGVLSHFELLSKIKRDIFWGAKDAIRKDQLKKRGQLIRFGHMKALLFKKKSDTK